jgi:hypothetical protein
MQRILAAFGLYWHYTLDTVLTHVFVIAFLQMGHPATAAVLMSVDSMLKIVLAVFVSHLSVRISPSLRGRLSAVSKFILIGIGFLATHQISKNCIDITIFIPFLIFKLVLLLDASLSADFIFTLRDHFKVDPTQGTAAQNILTRASTVAAPAIALTLLFNPYANIIIFSLALLVGAFYIILLRKLYFSSPNTSLSHHRRQPLSFIKLIAHPLMRWGLIYQMIANLAFAGVAFLLLVELKPHGNLLINEITLLYAAFFLVQCSVLFLGEKVIPANSTWHIALLMVICSLLIIIASQSPPGIIRLSICALIGLAYSFSISAISKVVTAKIRGEGFVEYMGWVQSTGRLASLMSTIALGVAASRGYLPEALLMCCGLLGMVGAVILIVIN